MTTATTTTEITNPTEALRFREAYEHAQAEIEGVPDHALHARARFINVIAGTVLGAASKIAGFEARIERELPTARLDLIRKLPTYACALVHAQTKLDRALRPEAASAVLVERAKALRSTLWLNVEIAVKYGVVSAHSVDDYRGGVGHQQLVRDLNVICDALREHWEAAAALVPARIEDIDEAESVARALFQSLIAGAKVQMEVAQNHRRAYAKLFEAYDEARKCLTFLLGDANAVNAVAPPLRAAKKPTKHRTHPEATPVAEALTAHDDPVVTD